MREGGEGMVNWGGERVRSTTREGFGGEGRISDEFWIIGTFSHSLIHSIPFFIHPIHSHFDSSLLLLSLLPAQDNRARLPRITGLAQASRARLPRIRSNHGHLYTTSKGKVGILSR